MSAATTIGSRELAGFRICATPATIGAIEADPHTKLVLPGGVPRRSLGSSISPGLASTLTAA